MAFERTLDPRATDFRPFVDGRINPNFMVIYSPVGDVSVFGTWNSLLRVLLNASTIRPGDYEGITRSLRGLGGGALSIAWDTLTGEDFVGNRVPLGEMLTGEERGKAEVIDMASYLARTFSPFAAEETVPALVSSARGVIERDPAKAAVGAGKATLEILGVTRTDRSPSEERTRLTQEVAAKIGHGGTAGETLAKLNWNGPGWAVNVLTGKPWDLGHTPQNFWGADPITKAEVKKHPEWENIGRGEAFGVRAEDIPILGAAPAVVGSGARFWGMMDEREVAFYKVLEQAAKDSREDDPDQPFKEYRGRIPILFRDQFRENQRLIDKAQEDGDIDLDRERKDIFGVAADVRNRLLHADDKELVEKLMGEYIPIEEGGVYNHDERVRRDAYLERTFGKKFMDDMTIISREGLPPVERARRAIMDNVKESGYWKAKEALAARADKRGNTSWFSKRLEEYNGLMTTKERRDFENRHPQFRDMVIKLVPNFRRKIRSLRPELDKNMFLWGLVPSRYSPRGSEQRGYYGLP